MKRFLKIVAVLILLVWIIFQFVLTYHTQESKTMTNTIKQNEFIWINKLSVGAWFMGMKLPGLSDIQQNDIVYFAFPLEFDNPIYKKTRMVSRVLGLPGDKVHIKHKDVLINDQAIQIPDSAKITYRVVLKKDSMNQALVDRYNIVDFEKLVDGMGVYDIPLTKDQAERLKSDSEVDYARLLKTYNRNTKNIFPDSRFISWSRDIFGPVKVPSKGDIINLDYKKLDIYREIIEFYEGNDLKLHKGDIFINNIRSNSYTVQKNYYFVLDDNRDKMNDSRKFGFIPEEYILGKVIGKK